MPGAGEVGVGFKPQPPALGLGDAVEVVEGVVDPASWWCFELVKACPHPVGGSRLLDVLVERNRADHHRRRRLGHPVVEDGTQELPVGVVGAVVGRKRLVARQLLDDVAGSESVDQTSGPSQPATPIDMSAVVVVEIVGVNGVLGHRNLVDHQLAVVEGEIGLGEEPDVFPVGGTVATTA